METLDLNTFALCIKSDVESWKAVDLYSELLCYFKIIIVHVMNVITYDLKLRKISPLCPYILNFLIWHAVPSDFPDYLGTRILFFADFQMGKNRFLVLRALNIVRKRDLLEFL